MRRQRSGTRAPVALVVAAFASLTGCATNVVDRNIAETRAFAVREVGVEAHLNAWADEREQAEADARALLAEPVTQSGAVALALRFSPAFQAMLADSAAASAAATQSARLPNPIVSFSRLAAGDVSEIDRALTVSLLDFLVLPQRRRLASLQQVQHRLRSAGDVVGVTTDVRQAWVEAVAARESRVYAEQAKKAAEASATLGRRMAEAGNFSRIEWARQQSFYAEATAELARAQLEEQRTREAFVRLLGLSADLAARLTLPDRLPDLPNAADSESVLAGRAFDQRLDVALARAELDFTARSLGLTRVTSTVNALEVGVASTSATGEETLDGYELELRVPLFDFGDARRANADAIYLAALNRMALVAAEAESHLRESYLVYRSTYDLAKHYRDEIVPLRKSISEENLLRYNGMLIGVFELLVDAREQVTSVRQAIAAHRDFWLADATLRSTLIGRPIEGVSLGLPAVTPGAGTAQPH